MKAEVFNQENKKVGTIDLPDKIFAVSWKPDLIHQVILAQLSNRRKPLAHTKTRGEVRGGGRKPWRQKHTGRARHGSIRSPLWAGGGVVFGPRKEKKFSRKINKKMKRQAIFSVLSKKLAGQEIKFIEDLKLKELKTKNFAKILKIFFPKPVSLLCIPDKSNSQVALAARNIEKVDVQMPDSLNVYNLLAHKYVFFEKEAVNQFVNHYNKLK